MHLQLIGRVDRTKPRSIAGSARCSAVSQQSCCRPGSPTGQGLVVSARMEWRERKESVKSFPMVRNVWYDPGPVSRLIHKTKTPRPCPWQSRPPPFGPKANGGRRLTRECLNLQRNALVDPSCPPCQERLGGCRVSAPLVIPPKHILLVPSQALAMRLDIGCIHLIVRMVCQSQNLKIRVCSPPA